MYSLDVAWLRSAVSQRACGSRRGKHLGVRGRAGDERRGIRPISKTSLERERAREMGSRRGAGGRAGESLAVVGSALPSFCTTASDYSRDEGSMIHQRNWLARSITVERVHSAGRCTRLTSTFEATARRPSSLLPSSLSRPAAHHTPGTMYLYSDREAQRSPAIPIRPSQLDFRPPFGLIPPRIHREDDERRKRKGKGKARTQGRTRITVREASLPATRDSVTSPPTPQSTIVYKIGRASCRERV